MVDKVSEDYSRGKRPGRVHSSTSVVHLKHNTPISSTVQQRAFFVRFHQIFFQVSHPHEMSNGDREADGEGSGSQTPISSLISYSKDADDKLHGEENLHGGGHTQADARLQLETKYGNTSETVDKKCWCYKQLNEDEM